MATDIFTHMEEAWKLEKNPFPSDAIRHSLDEPYSIEVYPEETKEFLGKFIRGGIQGNRKIAYLWSKGPGGDTGYGKTSLMHYISAQINVDLGSTVLTQSGMRPSLIVPIASVYANLNNIGASGLYPVLFQATVDATISHGGNASLFDVAWDKISNQIESDQAVDISSVVVSAWRKISPGGTPLRYELLDAFSNYKTKGITEVLSDVSQAARLRNGLQYFDFLIAVLSAANINHLFVFVDQLEDLATNRSITAAKRSREIGRIRDLIESEPYGSHIHFVFTFHNTAAMSLNRFWEENRLPSYEANSANASAVVILRGLNSEEQVAEVLKVYLDSSRFESVDDDLLPFDPDVLPVLLKISKGRIGIILAKAHELLDAAANKGMPRIDAAFAKKHLAGVLTDDIETDEISFNVDNIDDLLLND